MGVVLVGRDETLDREVAVKLVKPGQKAEAARLRLLREAQAMAKVAHPNVVAVYEAGLHDDGVYIAMELVHGQALDQWLKKPRTVVEILITFVQAGRGLAAAHAKGIIHRDFKPANVLVGDDNRTRVGDFGLARAASSADVDPDATGPDPAAVTASGLPATDVTAPEAPDAGTTAPATPDARVRRGLAANAGTAPASSAAGSGNYLSAELTNKGAMLGTPAYMSLEAFRGKATALSDQWSFAVALYRALFGVAPFVGEGVFGLFEAVAKGPLPSPPSASASNEEVPPRVTAAILKALAREPSERFPSMEAFVAEIERELRRDPDHDPERSRKQRRTIAIVITAFGLVSGTAIGLRTHFGQALDVRGVFLQAALALIVISGAAFRYRETFLRDAHGRRIITLLFAMMGAITLHRSVAILEDAPLLPTLRSDAIIGAALTVYGSVVLERWLAIPAALFGVFLVVSFIVPAYSVAAFGMAIVGGIALGTYFWRDTK